MTITKINEKIKEPESELEYRYNNLLVQHSMVKDKLAKIEINISKLADKIRSKNEREEIKKSQLQMNLRGVNNLTTIFK